jgi:hypothetical protein
MLCYWREYRTYFHIGQSYGASESAAYRNIKWCENTLAKSKALRLPGRKAVVASERVFDVVLIDATETPIERPKKQRRYYSGKKKRHTLKTQLVVKNRRAASYASRTIRDGATTSGCLRRQKSIFILRRKPLPTAAIKACRGGTPRQTSQKAQQKESVIDKRQDQKPRHLQRTRRLRERHRHAQPFQDHRRPLPKPPPPFRSALLPHRRHLQHGAQGRMTVMQEAY